MQYNIKEDFDWGRVEGEQLASNFIARVLLEPLLDGDRNGRNVKDTDLMKRNL